MKALRQAVRQALQNEALRAALTANAEQRKTARERAHASLPEPWDVLRQRAAQVRAEALAHWDQVLAHFLDQARANGFQVHLAANAAEARRIVLDILRRHAQAPGQPHLLVVKSKSMVSEEIGLNAALEEAGHQVVETDLGEFIIQLRGERPTHIITPAVHLRRQEVAQTFHQRLGMPYTEDVEAITATARRHLREVFLQADVGISGVNFGVAETGSLCIVTNEGNGRMVTTLPKVHIALMGRERLVRTPEDLALMLTLLPRSATGQDLTVYTTLIHGPRRAEEADGAPERHLVVVDNGRRRLAQTPLAEALRCIRCGACLNACPVYREIGGHAYVGRHGEATPYPGPIGIVVSNGLFGSEAFGNLAQLCTLCGACTEACPVAIPLDDLIVRVRAGQAPTTPPNGDEAPPASSGPVGAPGWVKPFMALYAGLAQRPALFHLAKGMARLGTRLLGRRLPVPLLQGAAAPTVAPRPTLLPAEAPTGAQTPSPSPAAARDLRESFLRALEALGGEVVLIARRDLAQALRERWLALGRPPVGAWAPEAFPHGLGTALREADLPLSPAREAQVGITGSPLAVAATGSVLIPSGPGRPQEVSLLPQAHWVLLPQEALVASLEEAFAAPAWRKGSMAVFVTGPSRTADIEMTLTIGVHGPERVVVFLVE
ncbi:MAG TPA: LUD domain-containing protein [Anaerolineae bacterium]|nr:LUD domain-containing protein [Anaerolineae bacterium]HID84572.1 4Fe-4S dicluster domain-containing protein [Anaerolineales bacterium]HIQ09860.1 4Fe-4S dicluster domain-containing protein [Anaerolineaceae bacterium]